jgi:hypothetical protein
MGKGRSNIEYFNSIGQLLPFGVAVEISRERLFASIRRRRLVSFNSKMISLASDS